MHHYYIPYTSVVQLRIHLFFSLYRRPLYNYAYRGTCATLSICKCECAINLRARMCCRNVCVWKYGNSRCNSGTHGVFVYIYCDLCKWTRKKSYTTHKCICIYYILCVSARAYLIIVCKNLPGPSSAEILLCSFNNYHVINTQ